MLTFDVLRAESTSSCGAASSYAAPSEVTDALTTDTSGNYVLTDKWGNSWNFDPNGLPDSFTDRNGNLDDYTYSGSYQITGWTDERGKAYSFTRNSNNFVTGITDFSGRSWSLAYDSSDNLVSVTTPTTPDQTSGITTTFGYDGSNRMTSITDGRGHTAVSIAYNGSTGSVSSVTLTGGSVSYAYSSGYTDRTDRNGGVHRTSYTGKHVTKTAMIVSSTSKYETVYRYTGDRITNIVYPLGNRVDFVYDSAGCLTERRRRTTDTSTNASSDLVESWTFNSSNFSLSHTDARGNSWSYARDSKGNRTGVANPTVTHPATQTSSRSIAYNAHGQVTSETDEEGRVTSLTYSTSGSDIGLVVARTIDPSGLALITTFERDSAGNVTTMTDPRGKTTNLAWDNLRRLTQTQAPSPLLHRVQFNYDGDGNLTKKDVENLDKDGAVVTANAWITSTYTYTVDNLVSDVVEEIDATHTRTTSLEYDGNRNLIRVSKPAGNKIKYDYTERDLLWKTTDGETSGVAGTEENAYDDNGNLTSATNPRGNSTTFAYDLFDRRTRATNALGAYSEWTYDENGNVTTIRRRSVSNVELQRTSRSFDERNRLWQTSDLFYDPSTTYSDAVSEIERYKTGEPKVTTNARGKATNYLLDAAGRLTKITDAMGNEIASTLDGNGNATGLSIKEIDGSTSVTHSYEATYDEMNRRVSTVEINRTNTSVRLTTAFGFDSRNNLVWKVDAEGNPTRWTFDGLSRMTKVERALTVGTPIENFTSSQDTTYGFDSNDRLISLRDDAGHETVFSYDARDRVTQETRPDATHTDFTYDANGDVATVTDPNRSVVENTYDSLDRLTARGVSRGSGIVDTTWETYAYDALDRLVDARDDDSKVELLYTSIGLSSSVYGDTQTKTVGTPSAKSVTTKVDANGNLTSQLYPSALSITRTYNDIDAVATITDGTNTIASYTYIGFRLKKIAYQNGTSDNRVYTGFRNEIASIQHLNASFGTLVRMDYGYDRTHNVTYERFGASGAAGDAFAYDKLGRLTTAWTGSVTPTTPSTAQYVKKIDYSLDDDGNRTSVTTTLWGATPTVESYTSSTLNVYTAVGGASRSCDVNGNTTDDGLNRYVYNYRNAICELRNQSNGLVATYAYDALGRRFEKVIVGGTTERLIYSGPTIVSRFKNSYWSEDYVHRGKAGPAGSDNPGDPGAHRGGNGGGAAAEAVVLPPGPDRQP